LVCTRDCTSCATAAAGFCVPTSPDTCDAGLHGCSQECDNGTPGSACVSTVGGALVCVQATCTFRTCNASGDCHPGEVCFTEGCCGTTSAATGRATAGTAGGSAPGW
jgi:hypothetical protein